MRRANSFCVFILTHGRPDRVRTIRALEKAGYTGDWLLVCDEEDVCIDEYRRRFGDRVVSFSKADYSWVDTCDAERTFDGVVYARNAAFDIARDLGYEAFCELDDDYSGFYWRLYGRGNDSIKITDFDGLCEMMVDWLASSPHMACTSIAQAGDYIGGFDAKKNKVKRKAMNVMFFLADRPVRFTGRSNEDCSAYCVEGMRGRVFVMTHNVYVGQEQTQKSKGGLTEMYLRQGTYVKSMYTVIQCPSFVTVRPMGGVHFRLHHHIDRRHGLPMILQEGL